MHHEVLPAFFIPVLIVAVYIAFIFYCLSLFKVMRHVPKENQTFPRWFVWLFLIPWFGFIFQWIMLPFGIPNALKKTFCKNQDVIHEIKTLAHIGLAQVIFATIGLLFSSQPYISYIAGTAGIVLLILYWCFIVRFKKRYLINLEPAS